MGKFGNMGKDVDGSMDNNTNDSMDNSMHDGQLGREYGQEIRSNSIFLQHKMLQFTLGVFSYSRTIVSIIIIS